MKEFFSQATSKLLGRQALFWAAVSIIASIVLALTDYGIAIFFQLLFKSLGFNSDQNSTSMGWLNNWQPELWYLLLLLALIGMVRAIAQLGTSQSLSFIEEIVRTRLRLISLYEILLSPSQKFVAATETHTKIGEIYPQVAACSCLLVNIISISIQALVLLLVSAYIAWQETLGGLIVVIIIGGLVLMVNQKIRLVAKKLPEEQRKLNGGIERISRNWLLVRTLRTNDEEYKSLTENALNYYHHFVTAKFLGNLSSIIPVFLGFVPFMTIIYGSFAFWNTPGLQLVACLFIFSRFLFTFSKIAQFLAMASRAVPHFKIALAYISDFTNQEIKQATLPLQTYQFNQRKFIKQHGLNSTSLEQQENIDNSWQKLPTNLELHDVSFSYRANSIPLLKNVSLTITPGEQIGFVGKSGSGKSTLLGLMVGIIEPNQGKVTIDNKSAGEFFTQSSVKIGYVGSEPFLIEGTIKDNLNYGSNTVYGDQEYRQALMMAKLWDVIEQFPEGLNYGIKENGEGLSAGQKQRLCLARAFINKPHILLLDEVSANLDEETETEIAIAVSQLKGTCTTLIASHRLGILKFADKIIDLHKLRLN